MSRLWVAGATGFLGSHLCRLLATAGHQVVAVSRGGGVVEREGAASLPVSAVDILDADAVAASAAGAEGAFLCTGRVSRDRGDAPELHRLHVVGTRHALAGLRRSGVRRVVVASTSGTIAVSRDPGVVATEASDAPLEIIAPWPYYRTKLHAEREALALNAPPEFEVVVVNPSLLLGPGDLRESSTADVRLFLQRQVPAIPPGGIAFVDVRDAAAGMELARQRGRAGERYLLNARNMTLAAFFQRLGDVSGVAPPALRLPPLRVLNLGLGRLALSLSERLGVHLPVDPVSFEMAHYYWYADASKAIAELGWEPRDALATLRETVDDLRARGVA